MKTTIRAGASEIGTGTVGISIWAFEAAEGGLAVRVGEECDLGFGERVRCECNEQDEKNGGHHSWRFDMRV